MKKRAALSLNDVVDDLLRHSMEAEWREERLRTAAQPVIDAIGPLSAGFTLEELAGLAKRFTLAELSWDWLGYVKASPDWVCDMFEGGWRRRIPRDVCEHAQKSRLGYTAQCRACGARFEVTYTYTLLEEQKEQFPHGNPTHS